MKLFTEKQRKQLLANGWETDENLSDNCSRPSFYVPVVKLFNPCGAATWLLTEIDPFDKDLAFGLCDLGMGCPELGTVSLSELQSIRLPFGLRIERDLHWTGTHTIDVYAHAARKAGRIVTDRESLDAAEKDEGP